MIDARKYSISVQFIEDDGESLYCATVKELPDVNVFEETALDAYNSTLDVIRDLQKLFASKGKAFPTPTAREEYSGRSTVRMSKSLHARVAEAAERDNISLNQWIVEAIAWRLDGAKTPRTVVGPNAISINYQIFPTSAWGDIIERSPEFSIINYLSAPSRVGAPLGLPAY